MKIAVLNGSPKGQISVTMQYVHFLQQNYKWRIINGTLVMLTKIPVVRREFIKRMKSEMIKPCANVV